MHDFKKSLIGIVDPPIVKKRVGRPKKVRRTDANDTKDSSKTSRKDLTYACAICLQQGHNKRSCKNTPHPNSRFSKTQHEISTDVGANTHTQSSTVVDEAVGQEKPSKQPWKLNTSKSTAQRRGIGILPQTSQLPMGLPRLHASNQPPESSFASRL
ncbi:uncharacterized protein LOC127241643 [Andrographis paniculata]|uniref:uncharacterized protein LOC127241643 n=1 Tax=Andrographis paniculata TaxID=175694 RepID=UPI0021E74896|nr:uncharacterized protein LOC127241643 [Andrographis paniculata]